MTSKTKKSVSIPWGLFFRHVQKQIKTAPIPYVTRVAARWPSPNNERAFAVLISCLISLRTRDATTETCSEALFKKARSPKDLLKFTASEIAELIYPCSFYKTKAQNILKMAQTLVTEQKNQTPKSLEQLVALPGVGRKTANLVLTEGWNIAGICVDIHVHRILNRIGFVKTKTADDTEMVLREILPPRYWKLINVWLVTFGQTLCKPIGPKCQSCSWQPHCIYS